MFTYLRVWAGAVGPTWAMGQITFSTLYQLEIWNQIRNVC